MKDPFSVCFSKYVLKENDHLTTFQNYDNLFKIPLVITFEEKFHSQCVFVKICKMCDFDKFEKVRTPNFSQNWVKCAKNH